MKISRAFLVVVSVGRAFYQDSAEELRLLTTSDGLTPVGLMQAKRDKPDPATFLGSGKIEELGDFAREAGADIVVFDIALSAAQERNIERVLNLPVLDRTELILDIFRQRAKSREGRLQVELARLEHLSTRLVRGWTHLERQRGGLGKTGGPGEKQIELDRRMIGVRMKQLRDQLKRLARQRGTQRRARSRGDSITVSLAGYTNAGKSTLFNKLTRAESYAADQLFATLDTTARKFWLNDEETVVATDTVGFIRGLPHQLIEAFKSTLDETVHADLLLHVVDASSPVREVPSGATGDCKTVLTCQTVSRWDMANFTATIAYEWFENGKLLGSAKYHAANGLNFSKYINTEEKVNELLNRMLPGTPALPTRYSE